MIEHVKKLFNLFPDSKKHRLIDHILAQNCSKLKNFHFKVHFDCFCRIFGANLKYRSDSYLTQSPHIAHLSIKIGETLFHCTKSLNVQKCAKVGLVCAYPALSTSCHSLRPRYEFHARKTSRQLLVHYWGS